MIRNMFLLGLNLYLIVVQLVRSGTSDPLALLDLHMAHALRFTRARLDYHRICANVRMTIMIIVMKQLESDSGTH